MRKVRLDAACLVLCFVTCCLGRSELDRENLRCPEWETPSELICDVDKTLRRNVGDAITCYCKSTCFILYITCLPHGKWDHFYPEVCYNPLIDHHRNVTFDKVEKVYKVTCEPGYELTSNISVKCIDGNTTGDLPECVLTTVTEASTILGFRIMEFPESETTTENLTAINETEFTTEKNTMELNLTTMNDIEITTTVNIMELNVTIKNEVTTKANIMETEGLNLEIADTTVLVVSAVALFTICAFVLFVILWCKKHNKCCFSNTGYIEASELQSVPNQFKPADIIKPDPTTMNPRGPVNNKKTNNVTEEARTSYDYVDLHRHPVHINVATSTQTQATGFTNVTVNPINNTGYDTLPTTNKNLIATSYNYVHANKYPSEDTVKPDPDTISAEYDVVKIGMSHCSKEIEPKSPTASGYEYVDPSLFFNENEEEKNESSQVMSPNSRKLVSYLPLRYSEIVAQKAADSSKKANLQDDRGNFSQESDESETPESHVTVQPRTSPEVPVQPRSHLTSPEVPVQPRSHVTSPEVPVQPKSHVPVQLQPKSHVTSPEVPVQPKSHVTSPEVPVQPRSHVTSPEVPVQPKSHVTVTPKSHVTSPEVSVQPRSRVISPEVPVQSESHVTVQKNVKVAALQLAGAVSPHLLQQKLSGLRATKAKRDDDVLK